MNFYQRTTTLFSTFFSICYLFSYFDQLESEILLWDVLVCRNNPTSFTQLESGFTAQPSIWGWSLAIFSWQEAFGCTPGFLTFVGAAAVACGQKIGRSLKILVLCNSSRFYKRQAIRSTRNVLTFVNTTAIAWCQDPRKKGGFWRYAIAVVFTNVRTLRVLGAGIKSVNTGVVIGNEFNSWIFEASHSEVWNIKISFAKKNPNQLHPITSLLLITPPVFMDFTPAPSTRVPCTYVFEFFPSLWQLWG